MTPYNGNDPPPAPGSLKALLFPPLLNKVQNKGTQGVQARYGAELPPITSIVRHPGRPVILVPENFRESNLARKSPRKKVLGIPGKFLKRNPESTFRVCDVPQETYFRGYF